MDLKIHHDKWNGKFNNGYLTVVKLAANLQFRFPKQRKRNEKTKRSKKKTNLIQYNIQHKTLNIGPIGK